MNTNVEKGHKRVMHQELISVIVPVYNIENDLDRCIQSVVEQTYSKLQIILVDDGSTDGSAKICDRWKKEDERIEVYHKENGGAFSARNFGIKKAVGAWIIFIDGDDYLELNMLEHMYESVVRTDSDMAICSAFLEYKDRREILSVFGISGNYFAVISGKTAARTLFDRSTPYNVTNSPCNKLVRKRIIDENHFFFPDNCAAEDLGFAAMVLPEMKRCVLLQDAYYHYFLEREGNTTAQMSQMRRLQDDMKMREEITDYYYQKGEKELGEWSQDDLLYTLLLRYVSLSDDFRFWDEQMKYLKKMIKKHKNAKRRRTQLGYRIWRISPGFFVRLMKKGNIMN